jgi:hypothetical protein
MAVTQNLGWSLPHRNEIKIAPAMGAIFMSLVRAHQSHL